MTSRGQEKAGENGEEIGQGHKIKKRRQGHKIKKREWTTCLRARTEETAAYNIRESADLWANITTDSTPPGPYYNKTTRADSPEAKISWRYNGGGGSGEQTKMPHLHLIRLYPVAALLDSQIKPLHHHRLDALPNSIPSRGGGVVDLRQGVRRCTEATPHLWRPIRRISK